MDLGFIILWVFLSAVAASIAQGKGRSGAGFFFLSIILSPLIGVIAALVAKPDKVHIENEELWSGSSKKCPHCAELIKKEAKVCRYCGRELPVVTATPKKALKKESQGIVYILGVVFLVVFFFFAAGLYVINKQASTGGVPGTAASGNNAGSTPASDTGTTEHKELDFTQPVYTGGNSIVCPLALMNDPREDHGISAITNLYTSIFNRDEKANALGCEILREGIPIYDAHLLDPRGGFVTFSFSPDSPPAYFSMSSHLKNEASNSDSQKPSAANQESRGHSSENPISMTTYNGKCGELTGFGKIIPAECIGVLISNEYSDGRLSINYTTKMHNADISSMKVVTFSGDSKKETHVDEDTTWLSVDKVIATSGRNTVTLTATGKCEFVNPYKAQPVPIKCTADTPKGKFAGYFLTNGSRPDVTEMK